jgi:hypothetical protein
MASEEASAFVEGVMEKLEAFYFDEGAEESGEKMFNEFAKGYV